MSDIMLHGVLNMPMPDDPAALDIVMWVQFKDQARQASIRIEELEAKLRNARMSELLALGQSQEAYEQQLAAEAKLAKSVQCFREIRQHCANSGRNIPSIDERIIERCEDTAASAIAELTGGNDG